MYTCIYIYMYMLFHYAVLNYDSYYHVMNYMMQVVGLRRLEPAGQARGMIWYVM